MSKLRLRLFTAAAALVAFASIGGANAASTELFISEYIEGSSNNKAIEIYNGTSAPVVLTGNYDLQNCANGSLTCTAFALTGTIASGDVFVFAHSGANAAILAQADQTTGAGIFNGNDAVVLRRGTVVVDAVGQRGFDPGTQWGTGLVSTMDNTLRRKSSIEAGDTNDTDVFDPALEWDGFANDTFDGLGSHTVDGGGETDPTGVGAANPGSVPAGANTLLTVAVTPGTNPASTEITVIGDLSQIGGSDTQAFFDDGTNGDAVAGNNVFSYGATVASATTPGAKSLPGRDRGRPGADSRRRRSRSRSRSRRLPPIEISEIQGAAHLSPRNGDTVTTTGIVIGKIGSSFYIQDPTPDANPDTSEGLQVFGASAAAGVSVGDEVSVLGRVTEFRANATSLTLTELTSSGRHRSLQRQRAAGCDGDRHRRASPAQHGDRGRRDRQRRGARRALRSGRGRARLLREHGRDARPDERPRRDELHVHQLRRDLRRRRQRRERDDDDAARRPRDQPR